jgi:RimJ/RimL family protein N-acetyltransferase
MPRLRRFTLADLPALHAIYGDAEVMRWVEGEYGRLEQTRAALARHIATGHWLAVVDDASGAVVGEVGLEPRGDGSELEIGWTFARHAWGRGHATRAAAELLATAPPDATVVARIHPENAASIALAERLGLTYERTESGRLLYTRGANVRHTGL